MRNYPIDPSYDTERSKSSLVKRIIGVGTAGLLFFLALFTWVFLIDAVKPDVGYEAVLIHKPLIFGHGGVDAHPVTTGRKYVWFSTDHVMVNVQPIQVPVHFEDLMSSDGVPLDFDAVIRLRITDSVKMIDKYGPKWYENNINAEFRNRVRQAVKKHGMNETAINSSATEAIDAEVSDSMANYIKSVGIPLQLIDVTMGKANPPDAIKSQRVETAAQQQRIQTEQEKRKAEDSRYDAEKSRAKADNAYREAMQLSPDQFLKLETIKMQQEACKAGHCTFLIGGGAVPTLAVK